MWGHGFKPRPLLPPKKQPILNHPIYTDWFRSCPSLFALCGTCQDQHICDEIPWALVAKQWWMLLTECMLLRKYLEFLKQNMRWIKKGRLGLWLLSSFIEENYASERLKLQQEGLECARTGRQRGRIETGSVHRTCPCSPWELSMWLMFMYTYEVTPACSDYLGVLSGSSYPGHTSPFG